MKQYDMIKSLSAMAHEGRLTILRSLIQAGPDGMSAGDLAVQAQTNVTTNSAQLLVLANAGLVRSRREGRHVFYTAQYEHIRKLMTFLLEDCCNNHESICCGLNPKP